MTTKATVQHVREGASGFVVEDLRTDIVYRFADELDAATFRTLLLRAWSISVLAAPGADDFVYNREDGRAEDDLEG